jgi:ribosomal protein S18 acetylase RimI-like enzyme
VSEVVLRRADPSDADVLLTVERDCGLEALGHVFPPESFPYPIEQVRARWEQVLVDPEAVTLLAVARETGAGCGFVCVRQGVVEHLGVDPARQREGIGSLLLAEAVRIAHDDRTAEVSLWCLVDNHRALSFYARAGWVSTGEIQQAEFAPFPFEQRLVLSAPVSERAS